MSARARTGRAGAVLVESLVSLAVGALVIVLAWGVVWFLSRQVAREDAYTAAVSEGRALIDRMLADLRRLVPSDESPKQVGSGDRFEFDVLEKDQRVRIAVRFDRKRGEVSYSRGAALRRYGRGMIDALRITTAGRDAIEYELVLRAAAPRGDRVAHAGRFVVPGLAREQSYAFWAGQ